MVPTVVMLALITMPEVPVAAKVPMGAVDPTSSLNVVVAPLLTISPIAAPSMGPLKVMLPAPDAVMRTVLVMSRSGDCKVMLPIVVNIEVVALSPTTEMVLLEGVLIEILPELAETEVPESM